MNAKEMFEKIGFDQAQDNNFYVVYTGKTGFVSRRVNVVFCKGDKSVEFDARSWSDEAFFVLSNALYLAIEQQRKELGWVQ